MPTKNLPHYDNGRKSKRNPLIYNVPLYKEPPTVQTLLAVVASHFGLAVETLKSATRIKSILILRQIAIYLIRKRTGIGFKEIGTCFGGKDHTTMLHAYRKMSSASTKPGVISDSIAAIESLIEGPPGAMLRQ